MAAYPNWLHVPANLTLVSHDDFFKTFDSAPGRDWHTEARLLRHQGHLARILNTALLFGQILPGDRPKTIGGTVTPPRPKRPPFTVASTCGPLKRASYLIIICFFLIDKHSYIDLHPSNM
jgi:hypothetical protein